MKLSVLVCAYNAMNTLPSCLDSILKQAIDLEIIVVNDGSSDQTKQICEDYAHQYDCIHVIHQENHGVGYARNVALSHAKGDYITYVDSDDQVIEHGYELVMEAALKDYDIIVYDAMRIGKNEEYMSCANCEGGYMSREDYFISEPCPWNKIIKREVWEKSKMQFPNGIIYEDYATIPNLCFSASTIWYMKIPVIQYYLTEVSITRGNQFKPKAIDILKASEYLVSHCDLNQLYSACEWMLYEHLLQNSCRYFLSFEKYDLCIQCAVLMKQYFPHFLKNKWVKQRSLKERLIGELFIRKQFHLVHWMIQIKK